MSVHKTLKQAKKTGWSIQNHIIFDAIQHNYILTDKENSCFITLWCKGNKVMSSAYNDFPYIERSI